MEYNKSISHSLLQVLKKGLIVMTLFASVLPAMAQEETEAVEGDEPVAKKEVKKPQQYPMMEIRGKVIDAATGEALAGVQLRSYNNMFYTAMTDEEGNYTISVPTFVTSLSANLEGYNLVRVALNGRKENVNIQLYSSRFATDYTARTRANRTVGITDFEETTQITADDEIHNRLGADVRSIGRNAIKGQGSALFINGLNSLNSNAQPLFIVDGVVFDML